jgi:ATP-dependent DNA helicase PIF1
MVETLTREQREAFDAVLEGKSVFITGPGGTGKSYLLKALYDLVFERTEKVIAITALTGCAALLLGRWAKTLHSWAGIGLGRESVKDLAANIKRNAKARKRWFETDILVIDEVSMLTPELFEKLNEIAKIVRRDERLFGGIQLVLVGDFYQLPPVSKGVETQFVFESPLWNEVVQRTIRLTEILRQPDKDFQDILNEARKGRLNEKSHDILKTRMDVPWQKNLIKPTLLFTRKNEVDTINERNIRALKTDKHKYKAETVISNIPETKGLTPLSPSVLETVTRLDKNAQYMVDLTLAVGAQVMLVSNVNQEEGLVNGSRGVVTGFMENEIPIVQFMKGQILHVEPIKWESEDMKGVYRKQIPLKLAYAVTIHKAQGATLDCALIDVGIATFEYGQAYTALSRVKNLESLYVWDLDPKAFRAHPKVAGFYRALEA